MLKEKLDYLILEASKNNFQISREIFEEIIDETDRSKVEDLLLEQKIYIVDSEDEDELEKIEKNLLVIPEDIVKRSNSPLIRDLSKYGKLSKEEEQNLGLIYLRGIHSAKILKSDKDNRLDEAMKVDLKQKIDFGDKAKEKILFSYAPLVISLANKYFRNGACGNVQFDELVLEAFTVLDSKFSSFDFDRGNRFSTFAYFYAKNAIRALVAANRGLISINPSAMFNRMKLANLMREFEQKNGRKMTEEDLLKYFNITEPKKREKFILKVRALFDNSEAFVHMDKTVPLKKNEEKASTYGDLIASREDDAMTRVAKENAMSIIIGIINGLEPKEKDIILKFFGLSCPKETLECIGQSYGISKERTRQIKEDALSKIRKELKKYNQLDLKNILLD